LKCGVNVPVTVPVSGGGSDERDQQCIATSHH
jgi:hypothetical protein